MSLLHAFLLGVIQGITEFFPISSSAHLKITQHLLGIQQSPALLLSDLASHMGTALALVYFFRKDLWEVCVKDLRKLLLIFLALAPLVPAYFLLKPIRDLLSTTLFLGPCLWLTAAILFTGERLAKSSALENLPSKKGAIWIGTMQAMALIPGISRSASTISCARVLGLSKEGAIRFSFLLSIPAVLGGNILESYKLYRSGDLFSSSSIASCAIAFIAALTVGLIMVRMAMHILMKRSLMPCVIYCLILGLLCTIFMRG